MKDANAHESKCTSGMTREDVCRRYAKSAVGRWFKSTKQGFVFFVTVYDNETRMSYCKLRMIKEHKNNLIQTTMTIKSFADGLDHGDFVELELKTALEEVGRICKTVYDNNIRRELA